MSNLARNPEDRFYLDAGHLLIELMIVNVNVAQCPTEVIMNICILAITNAKKARQKTLCLQKKIPMFKQYYVGNS